MSQLDRDPPEALRRPFDRDVPRHRGRRPQLRQTCRRRGADAPSDDPWDLDDFLAACGVPAGGPLSIYARFNDEDSFDLLGFLTANPVPQVDPAETSEEPAVPPSAAEKVTSGVVPLDWLPLVALGLTLVLWIGALRTIDLDATGDTGLVTVFPIIYFVGLGLVLVGVLIELARSKPRAWVLTTAVGVLVVLLHGTIPILYEEPRFSYVYKHIAVTRYVDANGTVDRSIEIYQNWSGFPGAAAHLSAITGVDPLAMANWALLFFAAANVLAVRFAVRALTTDLRIVALSTVVFVLGDWVGQAYFAPQSLAFLMSMVAVGVVLRCFPNHRRKGQGRATGLSDGAESESEGEQRPRRLRRVFDVMVGDVPADGRPLLNPATAVTLTLAMTFTVVVTHPLSQFVVIAWLAVLVLLGRGRLWWVPLIVLVMAIGWTVAAHGWLTTHVDLLSDVGAAAENVKGSAPASVPSPGREVVVRAARVLSVGIWAGAAVGIVAHLTRGRRDATAALLALAPFGMLFAQSYGGEMIYRVFMFSLPWCSFLIASGMVTGLRHRRAQERTPTLGAVRTVAIGVALGAMTVLLLTAAFGLERLNRLQPAEVAASTWFEENAAPGSVLTTLTPNFPIEITADYADFRTPWGGFGGTVIDQDPRFDGRELTSADVPAVITYLQEFGSRDVYLVLSPSQVAYNDAFRRVPQGTVERFGELLTAAPGVEVAYRSGDVTILKLPRADVPAS